MRVTDTSVHVLNRQNLAMTRERLADAQLRAATGRRVLRPSDDPLATALARDAIARENRAEAYLRSVGVATTMLQAADAALDGTNAVLSRIRELAVQASNDTLSGEQRSAIALEVEELREQIVGLANTESNGQYIFSGFLVDTPAFDSSGTYGGDGNTKQLEVGPGIRLDITIPGDQVFGAAGGGTDIFASLTDFITALQTNDTAGIRAALETVEDATNQISNARAELGSRMAAGDVARAANEKARMRAVEARTELIEVDPFVAFSEVSRAEYALQSAVQLASMLPLPGLVER